MLSWFPYASTPRPTPPTVQGQPYRRCSLITVPLSRCLAALASTWLKMTSHWTHFYQRWLCLLLFGQFGQHAAGIMLLGGMGNGYVVLLLGQQRAQSIFHSTQLRDFCCLLPKFTIGQQQQPTVWRVVPSVSLVLLKPCRGTQAAFCRYSEEEQGRAEAPHWPRVMMLIVAGVALQSHTTLQEENHHERDISCYDVWEMEGDQAKGIGVSP